MDFPVATSVQDVKSVMVTFHHLPFKLAILRHTGEAPTLLHSLRPPEGKRMLVERTAVMAPVASSMSRPRARQGTFHRRRHSHRGREVELLTIRIRLIICSSTRRGRSASTGGRTIVISLPDHGNDVPDDLQADQDLARKIASSRRCRQHAARHEKALEDTDGMKPTSCRSFWR